MKKQTIRQSFAGCRSYGIRHACFLVFVFCALVSTGAWAQPSRQIYDAWTPGFTKTLEDTHDLALPAWGLYSTKYNGISHVPSVKEGFRFDLSVHATYNLRSKMAPANVSFESGYHLWEASPDLSFYSCRYELEWKDKLFVDVSFLAIDEQTRLVKAQFVNNTATSQYPALQLFANFNFPPPVRTTVGSPLKTVEAQLPPGSQWMDAIRYSDFQYGVPSPQENLVYDGQLRGQVRENNTVNGSAILVGKNEGDKASYTWVVDNVFSDAAIIIRYRKPTPGALPVTLSVDGKSLSPVSLSESKDYVTLAVPVGKVEKGSHVLQVITGAKSPALINGFALVDAKRGGEVTFHAVEQNPSPTVLAADVPNALLLKYDALEGYYGMVWEPALSPSVRTFNMESLDEVHYRNFNKTKELFTNQTVTGKGEGTYTNLFCEPVGVKSGTTEDRYFYIFYGTKEDVQQKIKKYADAWATSPTIFDAGRNKALAKHYNKAGDTYRFSQQLMEAVTLTNVVYPVYTMDSYIKHNAPGREWDCLYTWDSGFIGIGMVPLNTGRALECLNAYTMKVTDQSAFLHHGSPVPTQAYLFLELWNETQNKEYLRYAYPRMKRYYQFMAGNVEHSSTRTMKSNVLKTWDYFYNSGGWDDYPPQVYIHKQKWEDRVSPIVTTSHVIRFAKILKMAATELGLKNDLKAYDNDINLFASSLQKYSWDEASGYFGYVMHDANGNPEKIVRDANGVNYNMGLDGCSPLVAGVCTPAQQQRITENLFTPGKLWSDVGISSVDQTAPYFSYSGYWNGCVWMPHQWFIWKTMLDNNKPDLALRIAKTALDVWKRETEDSYQCFELFGIKSGRGQGWHQFSGLSAPVLAWYAALYKPGTITTGFDSWVVSKTMAPDFSTADITLRLQDGQKGKSVAALICLNENYNYVATGKNGKPVPLVKVHDGLWQLTVPSEQTLSETAITIRKTT
ncbi:MGH1-like glycoside hydrolase domain-containing protein [Chryseolinea lacunae]|uniref:Mannosylglycerate hydrolase MGH1-like glycoside hydrolase domain-containing protein n=1 Tax=Chryseolinea lacunae TaxID=2801331 RepID=A0ABS1KZE4_9BACT|nr:trehalase family glycosidase [Chryseolinea lacunae]MBL0744710.1 hypothetical protein [Chryseolinea lacunae]